MHPVKMKVSVVVAKHEHADRCRWLGAKHGSL